MERLDLPLSFSLFPLLSKDVPGNLELLFLFVVGNLVRKKKPYAARGRQKS